MWEYELTSHLWDERLGSTGNQEAVREKMNAMGERGWELVSGSGEAWASGHDEGHGMFWLLMYWRKPR
jgi:hypothetical protein